ncbi:TonB-dependent receptor domain-containing protein [Rhodocyclus tenuis]|uniref:TonB-dependent receptor domain-containing protein n=1 Tax=Rhodocyclus tenuis TaxID=1066 RepID=UPI001904D5F7|nr:TonB-dependent receptor [Rhodocyclus tenuis]
MNKAPRRVAFRRRLIATLVASLCGAIAHAEDTLLGTVEVSADAEKVSAAGMQPDRSSPSTAYVVDQEAMRLYDTPGGTNPYTALAEIPGVKVSTVDAYGLNNTQGGQKGLRVRGEVSTHGVAGTLEGLPLGGPGPGPGYLFLFDKENIESIRFAQGAISADQTALFTSFGAIDTRLLWPREEARRQISSSIGGEGFHRNFVRLDSGRLASGTALFFSASDTKANKWRGYGDAAANRANYEFALDQRVGDLRVKLALAQNDQSQNNYKALTYAQATDLNRFRNYDYVNNPANSDHYNYNRQDFRNQVALAEIEYAFSPQTTLTFKPYYAKEEGYYLYASVPASQPNNTTQVQKWLFDHTTYGLSSELRTVLADTDLKFGYSWTSTEPPGPPTTRKQYRIVNGNLVFQQWSLLSKVVDRHEFENFYATAKHRFGDLTLRGGLRYAVETLPGINAYNTNGIGDVSADEAISSATLNATRSVKSRSFGNWLPEVGVSYDLRPGVEVHASLGRNIGAPSFDAFNQAPAGGITTSQQYWDKIEPELSTNLDIGARLRFDKVYVDPTIYFSRTRNKAVSVFSSTTNTVYGQNVGKTQGSGFQLAAGWSATNSLQLFTALSYSLSSFTEDVRTTGGAILPVEGKQLPDVPKWMGNVGAAWRQNGFTVAPIVQYVGPRWATTDYTQRVPGYFTADLTLGYGEKSHWGKWDVSLAILNVFDRKYIGQISTSEVNTSATGAIYYPGAPRTAVASVSLTF